MKKTKHLMWFATAFIVVLVITAIPLAAQQGGDTRTPVPAQDGQSPTVQEDRQRPDALGNNPNNGVTDVDRADSQLSWGMPILTLLVGLTIGYFLGNSRNDTTNDIRRDGTDRTDRSDRAA
jgi:hypothetical protein